MATKHAEGPVWALGTMSGTSMDGVDAAMVLTDGHRVHDFGPSAFRPYSAAEQAILRAGLGRWPGDAGVAEAAEVVETAHAELLAGFSGAKVIGFHGQTLAHDPRGRGTHQAGDGALLAQVLGIPVVWDFRSTDVQMGGQGAPLAPFYHFALARTMGGREPVVFLNLGGVGNLTWADPAHSDPDHPQALLAFDTGPANAPLNDLMQSRFGLDRDQGGALAATGTVDAGVIAAFLEHRYFYRIPPKSLDRNDFSGLSDAVGHLSDADAAATLTAAIAASVAAGLQHLPKATARVLVTGGGRLNPTLMALLSKALPCAVAPIEDAGFDGDMLEAQAFAHLAVRVARGLPTSCPGTTGVPTAVGGGRINRPEGDGRLVTQVKV